MVDTHAPLTGALSRTVEFAFSDRAMGSMSLSVPGPEGDALSNRAALAAALGVPADRLAWMTQVHGNDVVQVDAIGATPGDGAPTCDAMVTGTEEVAIGVLTADCVPVLLASESADGRGAVGAAHAGRLGVIAEVVPEAVRRLAELVPDGATRAVIGPAIGGCCYEVPPDMAADVAERHPATRARTTWGTPALDLVAGVRAQLDAAGVVEVQQVGGCTRCGDDARWFSHRSTTGHEQRPAGRQAGIIVRRAEGPAVSGGGR